MNGPKLVLGHRFEIMKFHLTNSHSICADAGLLLAVAFEGSFGRSRDFVPNPPALPQLLGSGIAATAAAFRLWSCVVSWSRRFDSPKPFRPA
jgi:hypothetical protein